MRARRSCNVPPGRLFDKEGVVAEVPKWGRSSKRRLRLIRWTRWEIATIAGLGCLVSLLTMVLAQWLAAHPFD